MSSILIWKISWLILSPNDTWRKTCWGVCWMLWSEAASVRCIPKKAMLLSTLENLVAPVSTWAISLRVGALWFSWMMVLFKSFGLRHILNLPFAFLGYVRELTHGVCSVCLVMIPWCTISLSSFFDLLFVLNGNFLSSMVYGKDYRVCLDVIFSWYVTYAVKAVGEQCLKIPGTVDGLDPGST